MASNTESIKRLFRAPKRRFWVKNGLRKFSTENRLQRRPALNRHHSSTKVVRKISCLSLMTKYSILIMHKLITTLIFDISQVRKQNLW